MPTASEHRRSLAFALANAWTRLERSLDTNLSSIRGISFAEYRLLRELSSAPGARRSRVDLARAVGLTPSGVTRSLRPLERLKIVETERSERDARLALATLTDAGAELVTDATAVVDDVLSTLLRGAQKPESLSALVDELVRS